MQPVDNRHLLNQANQASDPDYYGTDGVALTPAQQRAMEAGLGPRSATNAQGISDQIDDLIANTDLRMNFVPDSGEPKYGPLYGREFTVLQDVTITGKRSVDLGSVTITGQRQPTGQNPALETGLRNIEAMADAYGASGYGAGDPYADSGNDRWIPNADGLGGTVVGQRMTQAEMNEFDRLNPALVSQSYSSSSIAPIGEVEGFFAFNPWGQGLKGAGTMAYDAWTALPRAVMGAGTLAQDAYGYASNAIAPRYSVLTGEAFNYQPKSALLQSIQQQGVLGTIGSGITGAVRNAPGIGLIGALGQPKRDWGNVGSQAFNTALVGSSVLRTTAPSGAEVAAAARRSAIRESLTDASGRLLSLDERRGIKFTIREVEAQGYELGGSIKYSGNQGIDLWFNGSAHNVGRFALGEAKASTGLGSLARDAAGIRQGSFEFFNTRLQRGGRLDLQQQLQSGNVDLFGGFSGPIANGTFPKGKLYQFDPLIFNTDVNFRTTPGAATRIR